MLIKRIIHIAVSSIHVAVMKVQLAILYRRNYRKFKKAFYGLTLNSVGPLYGVARIKGESHRMYERRILKVACRRGPEPIANKMAGRDNP